MTSRSSVIEENNEFQNRRGKGRQSKMLNLCPGTLSGKAIAEGHCFLEQPILTTSLNEEFMFNFLFDYFQTSQK